MSAEHSPVSLLEGEEVLHDKRPSIIAYFARPYRWPIGVMTMGLIPLLYKVNSQFIVTDERVIVKMGILSAATAELRLDDIVQLSTGRSMLERLFGTGNIAVTAGVDFIVFYGIDDYQSVAATIRERQRSSGPSK